MSYKKNIILFCLATLILTACENKLDENVSFEVYAEADDSYMDGDVMVIKPNSTVNFHFSGDPDFITFYSGDTGAVYANINRTELPADEITSELTFTAFTKDGAPDGTMRVYLATSFKGLQKDDYLKDIERVENYSEWIDISEQCNLPVKANGTANVSIPMDEYLGQNIRIAFQYYTTNNSIVQSRWEIKNLKIVNNLIREGATTTLSAGSLGFAALDMYATSSTDAYATVTNNTSGKWNLANISNFSDPKIAIHSSSKEAALNHDWLISGAFKLNGCDPDTGTGIKNITQRVESHSYTYTRANNYVVTFIAVNANMEHTSQVVREIKIRVVE